jgi:hypothetical protein
MLTAIWQQMCQESTKIHVAQQAIDKHGPTDVLRAEVIAAMQKNKELMKDWNTIKRLKND